jgi:hypothetical protein
MSKGRAAIVRSRWRIRVRLVRREKHATNAEVPEHQHKRVGGQPVKEEQGNGNPTNGCRVVFLLSLGGIA